MLSPTDEKTTVVWSKSWLLIVLERRDMLYHAKSTRRSTKVCQEVFVIHGEFSPQSGSLQMSKHQKTQKRHEWHNFSSVQSLSLVSLFATAWTAACQASLSIEFVMPSNHLILCSPLLFPPSIFPSIRVFSFFLSFLLFIFLWDTYIYENYLTRFSRKNVCTLMRGGKTQTLELSSSASKFWFSWITGQVRLINISLFSSSI